MRMTQNNMRGNARTRTPFMDFQEKKKGNVMSLAELGSILADAIIKHNYYN